MEGRSKSSLRLVVPLALSAVIGPSLTGCKSVDPSQIHREQTIRNSGKLIPHDDELVSSLFQNAMVERVVPFHEDDLEAVLACLPEQFKSLYEKRATLDFSSTREVANAILASELSVPRKAFILGHHLRDPLSYDQAAVDILLGEKALEHLTNRDLAFVLTLGNALPSSERIEFCSIVADEVKFERVFLREDLRGETLLENLTALRTTEDVEPLLEEHRMDAVRELTRLAMGTRNLDQGQHGTCTATTLLLCLNNFSEMSRIARELFSNGGAAVMASGDVLERLDDAIDHDESRYSRGPAGRLLQSSLMDKMNGALWHYDNKLDLNVGLIPYPGALPWEMATLYEQLTGIRHSAVAESQIRQGQLAEFLALYPRSPATIYCGGLEGHAICLLEVKDGRVFFLDPNADTVRRGEVELYGFDALRVEDASIGLYSASLRDMRKRLTHVILPI